MDNVELTETHEPNKECIICGKKYYFCDSCKKLKTFKSWMQYADTQNCFKIFMSIQSFFENENNKETVKSQLLKCDLENLDSFDSLTKSIIARIMK